MIDLIYTSTATRPFQKPELVELLAGSRVRNARRGITGMLLYHEGAFMQVLEGEADAVQQLYERIALDRRHENISVILRTQITKRNFGTWGMGFYELDSSALVELPGFVNFFANNFCRDTFLNLQPSIARKLVLRFASNEWCEKVAVGRPTVMQS